MFRRNKGFTLIELLVVIAIIGILATIVLINLNTARDKAQDAAIKGALSEVRAAAEMSYDDDGNYNDVCTDLSPFTLNTADDYGRIKTSIEANGGTISCYESATDDAYCTESSLNATTELWCVDSKGVSQKNALAQCTAAGADCTP